MRLETITQEHAFLALRDEWNRLLSQSDNDSLPLTHEWVANWWQCFGGNRQLHILCGYDDDRLVAIAPLMRETGTYRGISCNFLKLMANGHSPYSDIIIDKSCDRNQGLELIAALLRETRYDIQAFLKISKASTLYNYLMSYLDISDYRFGIQQSLTTPIINTNNDWDAFFQSRPRKFRRSLANKINRFNKDPELTVVRYPVTETRSPHLADMVRVSSNSWKTQINNDLQSNEASRNFLFGLVERLGKEGRIELWLAQQGNQAIAYEFHVIYNSVAYPLRADYDESFKSVSPGSIVEYEALRALFEDGQVACYYSCADNYRYLRNWTDDCTECVSVEVFGPGIKGSALHAIEYKLIPLLRKGRDMIHYLLPRKLQAPRNNPIHRGPAIKEQ